MNAWAKIISRILIALMIWTPYQFATASMIGTDQVVTSTSPGDRTTVLNFLSRSDVAGKLHSLGIDPSTAQDRVAAMSDQEVQSLAGQINAMPAGGMNSTWEAVFVIAIVAAVVWWFWQR